MKLAYLAFTEKGMELAETLRENLGGQASRCGSGLTLSQWTDEHFNCCDGLVFVGATGIAVRAIAPHVRKKDCDPAVVVIDEQGNFAISLMSGHLGGANRLTCRIAEITGAQPVITTATDINRKFAVDVWSGHVNAKVLETDRIKLVSSAVLAGKTVGIYSPWHIRGMLPEHVELADRRQSDICLDVRVYKDDSNIMLHLVPRIGILGIGCRKNASPEQIEEAFEAFTVETGISSEAVTQVVSIDLKKNEKGIHRFCDMRKWPFDTFAAAEMETARGDFTESEFVRKTTGVGSVCERSVVCAGGNLIEKKFSHSGVTFAFGIKEYEPDWSWKE
ncbi:MAG: cobalt-precorrin 5A hydrolase [Firmicutes bacterium]|nr:cobalt-precorrin 5A hydrolase [Bacillota bacterium]